jgi:hypothetical protein
MNNLYPPRIKKCDRNDVRGLAEPAGVGWYREAKVKSRGSRQVRALLTARAKLVDLHRQKLVPQPVRQRYAARVWRPTLQCLAIAPGHDGATSSNTMAPIDRGRIYARLFQETSNSTYCSITALLCANGEAECIGPRLPGAVTTRDYGRNRRWKIVPIRRV